MLIREVQIKHERSDFSKAMPLPYLNLGIYRNRYHAGEPTKRDYLSTYHPVRSRQLAVGELARLHLPHHDSTSIDKVLHSQSGS